MGPHIFGSELASSRRRCRARTPAAIAAIAIVALSLAHAPLAHASLAYASPAATLSGRVVDETGAVVPHVEIVVVDLTTGLERKTETSDRGEFVLPGLAPASYQLTAQRIGFAPLQVPDIDLRVNDETVLNLKLEVSPIGEFVVVEANRVRVSPSAAVSTVADRALVANVPLSARSFQSLLWLVPGMVRTSGSGYGNFSANGQRDNANYLTIDGVSANVSAGSGATVTASSTIPAAGGGVPATSRLGTTNNLITVDAMEGLRIQTSSYAPELGRTPGAQIAITSRSGTNQLHGSAFLYERHDALDANDWFANAANLGQPALSHHQFGGVLGGPVVRNRAFFFGSYEGLRLQQPATMVTTVPSVRLREVAAPAVQRLLEAFPVPTAPLAPTTGDGTSRQDPYTASVSIPARLDATSVRIDALAGPRLTLFGRFNQAPSTITTAEWWNAALAKPSVDRTRTITGGLNAELSARLYNELRVNYSSNARAWSGTIDTQGGAAPLTRSDLLPTPGVFWGLFLDGTANIWVADESGALERQFNVVNSLTAIAGAHQIKIGVDIRRLALRIDGQGYVQALTFATDADIVNGIASQAFITLDTPRAPVMWNYSAYAQDTWHATRSLTLTYGLRWDANPAPVETDGRRPYVLRGTAAANELSTMQVMPLPDGESLYRTRWGNVAPRVGASYQLAERGSGWETVLRSGAGVFYDLGNASPLWAFDANPPFAASVLRSNLRYPLSAADAAPPSLNGPPTIVVGVDPNLQLPYTWQWNAAVAQSLGQDQTLTVTYVGAAGRHLLQRQYFASLPAVPSITGGSLITSDSTSAYRALQVQLQRRLSNGLQALASYSWAHAQDAQSDDLNVVDDQQRWGDADFDVRHSVAAALIYDLPSPRRPALSRALGHWGIDATVRASSAYPFTPRGPTVMRSDGTLASTVPDLVPGVPTWIVDPGAAGGRRLNPAAFTLPADGQQGDVGRNRVRGFPFSQVDLAMRRAFHVGDRLRLSVRVEAFNVLNHPNFMNPSVDDRLGTPNFGRATQMANRGFGGVQGPNLQQVYESGGPRSMQMSLRVEF